MKKLAYWSHQHPWKARIIIAMCHLALWPLCIFAGIQLFMEDIVVSQLSITFMALVFAAAYAFYPIRNIKEGLFKYSFKRRVRHDIVLLASAAWIVAGSVNQYAYRPVNMPARDIPVTMMVVKDVHNIGARTAKLGMKEMKGKLKEFRKAWKQKLIEQKDQQKEKSVGLKIVLVLLTLLGAFAMFVLVSSLACNLSCGGNEALAVIVFIGGTLGIVLLCISAFRAIFRKRKIEEPTLSFA